jgi:hypothetical protein
MGTPAGPVTMAVAYTIINHKKMCALLAANFQGALSTNVVQTLQSTMLVMRPLSKDESHAFERVRTAILNLKLELCTSFFRRL